MQTRILKKIAQLIFTTSFVIMCSLVKVTGLPIYRWDGKFIEKACNVMVNIFIIIHFNQGKTLH